MKHVEMTTKENQFYSQTFVKAITDTFSNFQGSKPDFLGNKVVTGRVSRVTEEDFRQGQRWPCIQERKPFDTRDS